MQTQNVGVVPVAVIIQLDNPVSPPQWGAPVLLSACTVVVNEHGANLYPPTHAQRPMASSEFGDDLLQATNIQLAKLGFKLVPINGAN